MAALLRGEPAGCARAPRVPAGRLRADPRRRRAHVRAVPGAPRRAPRGSVTAEPCMAFGFESTTTEVLEGVDLHGTRRGRHRRVDRASGWRRRGRWPRPVRTSCSRCATTRRERRRPTDPRAGARCVARGRLLDLTSLESVRAFAAGFLAAHDELHLLVNNAGVMYTPVRAHRRGLRAAVRHQPRRATSCSRTCSCRALVAGAPSRVVNLWSGGHMGSDIVWDDPNYEQRPYDKFAAYGQSKTANILFSVELDRRLGGRGVHAYAVHPGMITTELGRYMTRDDMTAADGAGQARPVGRDAAAQVHRAGCGDDGVGRDRPRARGAGRHVPRRLPGDRPAAPWARDPSRRNGCGRCPRSWSASNSRSTDRTRADNSVGNRCRVRGSEGETTPRFDPSGESPCRGRRETDRAHRRASPWSVSTGRRRHDPGGQRRGAVGAWLRRQHHHDRRAWASTTTSPTAPTAPRGGSRRSTTTTRSRVSRSTTSATWTTSRTRRPHSRWLASSCSRTRSSRSSRTCRSTRRVTTSPSRRCRGSDGASTPRYCSPTPSQTLYGFGYNGCLIPPDPTRMPDSGGQLYKYVSEKTGNEEAHARDVLERDRLREELGRHAGIGLRRCRLRHRVRQGPAAAAADQRRHARTCRSCSRRTTVGRPTRSCACCPSTASRCGRS